MVALVKQDMRALLNLNTKQLAIAFALAAMVLAGFSFYYSSSGERWSATEHLRTGDSPNYLFDALAIQHRVFGYPGETLKWVEAVAEKHNLRVVGEGQQSPRFSDRVLITTLWALILKINQNDVTIIYRLNLVLASLALGIVAYIATREFNFIGGLTVCVISAFTLPQSDIFTTLMLESTVSAFLALLILAAWTVLRHRGKLGPICSLFALCVIGLGIKNSIMPLCFLGVLTCGWSLSCAMHKNHRWWLTAIVSLALVLVFFTAAILTRNTIQSVYRIPDKMMARSNLGYGLWMGSLPSVWTGSYAGRISGKTQSLIHSHISPPEYRKQGKGKKYDRKYWVSLRSVAKQILCNYSHFPLDAVKRFVYRYTRITRLLGIIRSGRCCCSGSGISGRNGSDLITPLYTFTSHHFVAGDRLDSHCLTL